MYAIRSYIAANKLMSGVIIYFVLSILLKIGFSINVLVPCLWKTIFDFECWGCGLTTAFINILKLDIASAYTANPLIFVVLPVGMFFIYKDFKKFNR